MWPFRAPAYRVLIVCTANVCRSPAAEALLRHQLRLRGLHRKIAVASAGTDVRAPGSSPDPRMVAIAREVGVSLRGIRARPLDARMVAASDVIWVMERSHAIAIEAEYSGSSVRILSYDPSGADIPDPFFGDKAGVRRVFDRLGQIAVRRGETLAQGLESKS